MTATQDANHRYGQIALAIIGGEYFAMHTFTYCSILITLLSVKRSIFNQSFTNCGACIVCNIMIVSKWEEYSLSKHMEMSALQYSINKN